MFGHQCVHVQSKTGAYDVCFIAKKRKEYQANSLSDGRRRRHLNGADLFSEELLSSRDLKRHVSLMF